MGDSLSYLDNLLVEEIISERYRWAFQAEKTVHNNFTNISGVRSSKLPVIIGPVKLF